MAKTPDLLSLVANERKAAIGFDNDAVLLDERGKSLEYMKGEMRDVPALPMRSKAVSTDVNDAIETLLPDLIEIFTGTDDVIAFTAVGEEDEPAAQQETDYINHVVFHENDGFMLFYTGFKDALSVKAGIFKWWWEDYRYKEEIKEIASPEDLQGLMMQAQDGRFEIVSAEPDNDAQVIKVTLKHPDGGGCVKMMAVPPEDFAYAKDTVFLRDTTYCAMRSYPRAQDLIADGYDAKAIEKLPAYVLPDEQIERARSTAGEEDTSTGNDTTLRQVEIVEHFIKVVEGKEAQLWRIVTGADETVELEKEKVDRIQFALVTPYPVSHRLMGRSVADLTREIQKIRTSLLRMLLDSGYFALNQRYEVSETDSSPNTIADLLRNEPGVPVRSKNAGAVKAISAGTLNFDVQGALEFVATMSEQRTGIVRNAQGLNPDTLHDTAKGAMALMTAAMKRTRLIARIFAETGVKDLFMGVHAMTRAHATKGQKVKLRNKWVEIDPTSWGSRNDMTIEIGVGAGGREHEQMKADQLGNLLERLIAAPGGAQMVPPPKLYHAAKKAVEAIGYKDPDQFLTDPSTVQQSTEPQPNPEMEKAQADMAIQRQKVETEGQLAREKAANDLTLAREKMQLEAQLDRERAEQEGVLRREQFQLEAQLKFEAAQLGAGQGTNVGPVRDGGAVG